MMSWFLYQYTRPMKWQLFHGTQCPYLGLDTDLHMNRRSLRCVCRSRLRRPWIRNEKESLPLWNSFCGKAVESASVFWNKTIHVRFAVETRFFTFTASYPEVCHAQPYDSIVHHPTIYVVIVTGLLASLVAHDVSFIYLREVFWIKNIRIRFVVGARFAVVTCSALLAQRGATGCLVNEVTDYQLTTCSLDHIRA